MVRGAALAVRTGGVIAGSVALAVLLSVVLANLNFERTLRDVTGSRLAVAADELRRHVELGLTLGLDLSELVDVQALADRAAAGSGILGVEVVDDRGTVLFAADRAAIGRPSPAAGEIGSDGGTVVRRRIMGDTLLLGADLRNSFGQVVGAVVMRASLAELRGKIDGIRAGLVGGTLALVAAAGLGALAAVFATVRTGGGESALDDAGAVGVLRDTLLRQLHDHTAEAERALDAVERDLAGRPAS
ncbi:MAG TPA: hypothetical protein VD860_02775 [Azospirillum sp.]|nr:hypothetical protein [Azospirillum sp.]